MHRVLKGALAGAIGTAAMTVALRRVFPRVIPPSMQRGLLPKKVVQGVERKAFGHRILSEKQEMAVTWPSHYGYGVTAGVSYGLIRTRMRDRSALAAGALYGLVVWAASYEGWLPAAGILPATTDRPPTKWPVPILAHLVYGTTTGLAYEVLDPRDDTGRRGGRARSRSGGGQATDLRDGSRGRTRDG